MSTKKQMCRLPNTKVPTPQKGPPKKYPPEKCPSQKRPTKAYSLHKKSHQTKAATTHVATVQVVTTKVPSHKSTYFMEAQTPCMKLLGTPHQNERFWPETGRHPQEEEKENKSDEDGIGKAVPASNGWRVFLSLCQLYRSKMISSYIKEWTLPGTLVASTDEGSSVVSILFPDKK